MLSPRLPWIESVVVVVVVLCGCYFHLSSCWHSSNIVARRLSSPLILARNFIIFEPRTRFKLTPDQPLIVSSLSTHRTVSTSHFGSWSGEQDVKSSLQDATLQPQTPTQTAQSVGMMNDVSNAHRFSIIC